jgi:hypothetical protein
MLRQTGADHLLQTKRSRLFLELTIQQDETPLWGYEKEKELFTMLQQYISSGPILTAQDLYSSV